MRKRLLPTWLTLLAVALAACGGDSDTSDDTTQGASGALEGTIVIDGSSTVTPLMTVAAEDFQAENPDVRVTVATSGTGGGFEKFCVGETDVSMASRPITEEETATCGENGIEPVEFIVANDALSVIVNPDNDWATCLTVEEINKMWAPESEGVVTNWNHVNPSFPDRALTLFGAGSDSGTFDYFTDEINGEEGAIRTDYNPSEDDNVTIVGVEGDPGAVGFLGLSYVLENQGRVIPLEVDGGAGCVAPSAETVIDGSYVPLGRPLFVYFKAESLQRAEVGAFARFYADNQESITTTALFIPLSEEQAAAQQASLDAMTGS
ncbi:MAG TPA: PstS family phosphate ABC transporter substrate-binding protein [Acidimicrobiia bacterium]|nr:PstS family phosphate ABC transporter substrate-binding protein [Acidimicrobiia bacterium]